MVCLVNQDWEDECGRTKRIQQNILLPHEIVGTFLSEGETDRMTGGNDDEARLCIVMWAQLTHELS